MSTHKKIDIICIAAILFSVACSLLLMGGKALGIMPVVNAETGNEYFTANDLNTDWDTSSATKITLSDSGSTVKGNGAYTYNGDVYIVYAGHYILSGELTDGSVIINADNNDKIWLSLNGVSIHCVDNAALRVEQADKVFLTLADGTSSTLSSGAQYSEDAIAAGVDGTIYSRDDLTLNGTGALVVSAAYQHGIVCNDDLAITGGNLTIDAVQDGIHANDSVRIRNAAISVTAGDDGITVSNDDETAFLYMESGSLSIPSCYEGLEAMDITIVGGTVDIRATDDGINANGRGQGSAIRITGGDITIINPSGRDADGLDSNGSIYIEGGRVFISVTDNGMNCALDYGSENGGECVVSGGTVIACGGSTMAEGFDQNSPQGFLMYNTTALAGTAIRLMDSSNRELLSEEIPCSFSSVVISTPELKLGDICTIEVGDVQEQVTIDNTSSSGFRPAGMFGGGGKFGGDRFGDGMSGDSMQDGKAYGKIPNGQENSDVQPYPNQKDNGHQGKQPQDMPDVPGFPDGMEPPDGNKIPYDERLTDGQDMLEAGGRAFASDAEQAQRDGARSPRQDWGQMYPGGNNPSSSLSADKFVLTGISVLALLTGLFIALKIRH